MNLLENYIKEIHSVNENKFNGLTVDVTVNCYGSIRRTKHFTTKEMWEIEKKQGYFMA